MAMDPYSYLMKNIEDIKEFFQLFILDSAEHMKCCQKYKKY